MVNKDRLIKLLKKLISINSENPPGNEAEIGRFVRAYLDKLGLKTKVYEFKKNRPNVIGVLEGKDKSKSLLLTPHLDTVPAGRSWKRQPWRAKIENGRLYGLGATDCKCNIACALEAMRSLVEERRALGYNLLFAATADEESGSGLGLIPLLEKGILKPSLAVVLDADDFDIIITQKGLIHLKVKLSGKKAHGAYPWRGKNAISAAVNMLKEIQRFDFGPGKNKYLRAPTVNIGTIKGGDKVNVVADWCEFELDFRFLPGMSDKKILSGLKQLIKKYSADFAIEIEGIQDPYYLDEKHYLVSSLASSMRKLGLKPKIQGSEGATVITFFQEKGIPAVATGFGTEGTAHTADEYVRADNLHKGALALEEFLKNFKFKN